MSDDGWDLDHNGIPDSIQRDPVVVPEPAAQFGDPDSDPGLPGINAPIDSPAEPATDPTAAAGQVYETQQDVTQNKMQSANRAAEAVDEYIRE